MAKYKLKPPGSRQEKAEKDYLARYVFAGLTDINTGFDVWPIRYFTEEEFRIVLSRIKEHRLGLFGIEPFKDGEWYNCRTFEEYGDNPTDPNWYMTVFDMFREKGGQNLQWSARYYVPDALLQYENEQ